MRSRVRNGRWQRLQRGVYAAFSGEPSSVITITVLASRSPARLKDPWRRRPPVGRDPANQASGHAPAAYRVEDMVLDLIEATPSFDDAYAWICRAIGRRRTTHPAPLHSRLYPGPGGQA
jgi:hypothetical protein